MLISCSHIGSELVSEGINPMALFPSALQEFRLDGYCHYNVWLSRVPRHYPHSAQSGKEHVGVHLRCFNQPDLEVALFTPAHLPLARTESHGHA